MIKEYETPNMEIIYMEGIMTQESVVNASYGSDEDDDYGTSIWML